MKNPAAPGSQMLVYPFRPAHTRVTVNRIVSVFDVNFEQEQTVEIFNPLLRYKDPRLHPSTLRGKAKLIGWKRVLCRSSGDA